MQQALKRTDDIVGLLKSEQAISSKQEAAIKAQLDGVVRSIKVSLGQLEKLIEFFQPKVLQPLCEFATALDNPQKRQYEANFMMIACHRGKKPQAIVRLPAEFVLPQTKGLDSIQERLRVI